MITIAQVVNQIISRSPFLEEALAEDLINVSSLARKILPEVSEHIGKPLKTGAVIMAINRRQPRYEHKIRKGLKEFVRQLGDFTVRSNLMDYTFENSNRLRKNQALLLKHLEEQMNIFYTVSQGIRETTIIISASQETLMDRLFKSERLVGKKKHISTITMQLPEGNNEMYGVYYYILKQLAWEGINIVEVISTTNEFTIVVHDRDINTAFARCLELKKK